MSNLIKGRHFQLWEYHVGHGSLLIRSPAWPDFDASIDIISVGVEYLACARHLGEITITKPSRDEVEHVERMIQKGIRPPRQMWVLESATARFLLVAADLQIKEHYGGIFDGPFKSVIPKPNG